MARHRAMMSPGLPGHRKQWTRAPIWLSGLAILLGPPPEHVVAQTVLEVTPGCQACQIVLDTVASLGDAEGPGMIAYDGVDLAEAPDGRFMVLVQEAQHVVVFSPEGRALGTVGRRGQGPGEFSWPQALDVGPGGELIVVDRVPPRISRFSEDLGFVDSHLIPEITPSFQVFLLPDDSIFLSGTATSPMRFGQAVHVLTPGGAVARSFGEPAGPIISGGNDHLERRLAIDDAGSLWLGDPHGYELEEWTREGSRVQRLTADVDWFEPPTQTTERDLQRPRPLMHSVLADEDGVLWVSFILPGVRWQDALQPDPDTRHGWSLADPSLWVQTVIDAIDPVTGELLARTRLPGASSQLFGDGVPKIGRTGLDLDRGLIAVNVIQLSLAGR